MKARWPQSGYYEVSSSIWLHAHWGQFTSPGWRFLHVPGGGSGFLDVANFSLHSGTYVSLVPPQGEGLTVIIETFAETSCLKRNLTDLTITFTTKGELPGPGTMLYVWTSTQSALFVQQPNIVISQDSTFTVTILPDSMMTITTIATGNKGNFSDSPIPAQSPWPLPFSDDFSTYQEDSMARYFADQGGSWAVRNGSLQQVVPIMPIAWAPNGDPLTIAGSEDWIDYAVSATFIFSPKQPTELEVQSPPHQSPPQQSPPHQSPPQQSPPQQSPLQRQGATQRRRLKFSQRHSVSIDADSTAEESSMMGASSNSNSASVFVASCDKSDGSQIFSFNGDYIASSWGPGGAGCLTTCGCDVTCLQMYGCGVPGCSSIAYNWTLQNARLINSQYPTLALQADAITGTVSLVKASSSAPEQEWDFDPSTGLLRATALGVCLSQLKPSQTYVAVCGRVSNYNGFNAATTPAYCTALYSSGVWALLVNSSPSISGNVTSTEGTFDPTTPHRLTISMAADVIEAYIDGKLLGSINDNTYVQGNAAIGGGWHPIEVNDFEVTVPL